MKKHLEGNTGTTHQLSFLKLNCIYTLLLVCSFVVLSCSEHQPENLISYSQAELLNSGTAATDILSDYDIIPLDTAANAVLSYITKVKSDEGLYFVLEKGIANKLVAFNGSGAYVGQIPSAPEGTNPLRDIADFALDTVENRILVLDGQTKKMLTYNYALELVREIQLDFYAYALEYQRNRMLFATTSEDHALYITDAEGSLVSKHFTDDRMERVRMFQPFDATPTGVLYNHWEDDVIYVIENSTGEVKNHLVVDFPATGSNQPGTHVRSAHEVNGTLVLSFQIPEIGPAVLLHHYDSRKSVRFTELDNDVTYTRHFLLPVVGKHDDYLISYLPAEYLAQAARNTTGRNRNERFEAAASRLTTASNAALLFYRPDLDG